MPAVLCRIDTPLKRGVMAAFFYAFSAPSMVIVGGQNAAEHSWHTEIRDALPAGALPELQPVNRRRWAA